MKINEIPQEILQNIRKGCVIPAHPLALTEKREMDEGSMRVLNRYYMDAGVGGLAVGVHSTQFEIREKGDWFVRFLVFAGGQIRRWPKRSWRAVLDITHRF